MICERISIQTENSAKDTHLDTYILEDFLDGGPKWKRPLVLICPGGAYARTSNREAEPIALQMTAMGYHAAVLRYSCAPAVYPTALHEVALSVKYLRDRAQQWHIDTDKILVMGFSAGGHLAASYGVFWQEEHMAEAAGCSSEELRPQGLILCYPVISSDEKIAHTESIRNLLGDSYEKLKEKMSRRTRSLPRYQRLSSGILLQMRPYLSGIPSGLYRLWEKKESLWNIIFTLKESTD